HLFILRREPIGTKKKKLASQQADSIGACRGGPPRIIYAGGVAANFDPATIARHGRLSVCGSLGRRTHGRDDLGGRIEHEGALVAVEQHRLTILDRLEQAGNANDRGQARARARIAVWAVALPWSVA